MALASIATLPLTGTLPVRPFGDQLYGTIDADGQQPKVAALACTIGGELITLSLAGYDTSVAAALARLHAGKGLLFCPGSDVAWGGHVTCSGCPLPIASFRRRSLGHANGTMFRSRAWSTLASGCCIRPPFPMPRSPRPLAPLGA